MRRPGGADGSNLLDYFLLRSLPLTFCCHPVNKQTNLPKRAGAGLWHSSPRSWRVGAGGGGGARPPRPVFPEWCGFPRAVGIALEWPPNPWVGQSPNVSGRAMGGGGRCRVPVGSSPASIGKEETGDAVSWQERHQSTGSEQPCWNISNEVGRLSCGSVGVGHVRAVCEVLCVCQGGQRVPAGQPWAGAGGVGAMGVVGCCSTRCSSHSLAGAVCPGRGMGLDCRKMSCGARIAQTGSFHPRLREVIRICKSALCSVLWKCEPICCFP